MSMLTRDELDEIIAMQFQDAITKLVQSGIPSGMVIDCLCVMYVTGAITAARSDDTIVGLLQSTLRESREAMAEIQRDVSSRMPSADA